jgi:Flp pilus assembly protein TadB
MPFSPRIRYLLVTLAILLASLVEWLRGISPVVVIVAAIAFLAAGNFMVYRSGSAARARRRQQELDYWTN